eukprot:CAMPEP_0179875724 /NCGR_PEP_ID=MMETSP0982-20121206/23755_1 /TAXON_ID=483367 /ORGANISM="non described non described, Strain CCMP 2436" /LENGTH=120 /DNA_ID=CAMNT_0021767967 /DNA_START=238 /DNA_END=597 /DNA_ORIENTATION=-
MRAAKSPPPPATFAPAAGGFGLAAGLAAPPAGMPAGGPAEPSGTEAPRTFSSAFHREARSAAVSSSSYSSASAASATRRPFLCSFFSAAVRGRLPAAARSAIDRLRAGPEGLVRRAFGLS